MGKRKLGLAALALASAVAAFGPAKADGLPGMRGHDHTGITVPDMDQAVKFFTEIVGCQKIMSFGPFYDSKGTFMKDVLDVNPRAVITQITMIRCGYGSNIELFSYESPDQKVVQPKNSDVGGYHIAFLQPTTSVKKVTACVMSGTVTPVWSWPRMPGIPSAEAAVAAIAAARNVKA